ncbi:protein hupE [Oceanisphaera marina]|uniref:Protein hupE n=1 Tax=Oceanisphaera marina TaxID=2017550 RepID=A0ABQ1IKU0_9GAMM|nr:HupE/UreJ family protein [Oceanisphaera marina]GGB43222.1 protein hupE [Oceanisphaera marina]
MIKKTLTALVAMTPALALAHPGHGEHSLTSGFMHPLLGWDHLLAMVAVGMLMVANRDRSAWQLPLAFIGFMLLGAIAGIGGLALPGVEIGIVFSLLVLGMMLATGRSGHVMLATGLCALFGLFHGNAHGLELPANNSAISYIAGFLLATGLLHGAGWLTAARIKSTLIKGSGAIIVGAGLLAAF